MSLPPISDIVDTITVAVMNSLIALMLGRLRMSVDDATKAYAALIRRDILEEEYEINEKSEIFKASTLENAFQKIIADHLKKNNELLAESHSNQNLGNAEAFERMMDPRADGDACKA